MIIRKQTFLFGFVVSVWYMSIMIMLLANTIAYNTRIESAQHESRTRAHNTQHNAHTAKHTHRTHTIQSFRARAFTGDIGSRDDVSRRDTESPPHRSLLSLWFRRPRCCVVHIVI